jgi:hypothetical protein
MTITEQLDEAFADFLAENGLHNADKLTQQLLRGLFNVAVTKARHIVIHGLNEQFDEIERKQ